MKNEHTNLINNRVPAVIVITALLVGAVLTFRVQAAEQESTAHSSSTQSPSQADQLAEVVVTARKMAELLQNVPITDHAITAAALANLAPQSFYDLDTIAPGLNYQDIGGGRSGGRIEMRGISAGIVGASRVSVFLDGVYLSGDIENIPFQFMKRVEAVSGPQSAEFGRSTFAGAVNYVTKDPPKTFSGEADVSYGTQGDQNDYVSVGGPLTDRIHGIAYVYLQSFQPDFRSLQGGQIDSTLTRETGGKVVFDVTDNLSITASSFFSEDRDSAVYVQWADPITHSNLPYKPFLQGDGNTFNWLSGPVSLPPFDPDDASQYINPKGDPWDRRREWRSILLVTYVMPNGSSLTLNEGYFLQRESPAQLGTILGSMTLMESIDNPNYGLSWSNEQSSSQSTELRFTSPSGGRFHYMGGLFFQNLNTPDYGVNYGANICLTICTEQVLGQFLVNTAVTPVNTGALARDKSIFFSVGYDFTDKLTADFEGRYQDEYITSDNYVSKLFEAGTFNAFLPRATLQYKLTDHLNFYSVYSVGNNPGGFNTSQYLGLPGTDTSLSQRLIGEEKLYNYEVGMKSTWLNDTFLLNVTLYDDFWDDMQVPETFATPSAQPFSVTENVGSAKINGVELDSEWIPLPGLNLSANLFWNNGVYTSYCSQNYGALLDESDLPPPNKCLFVDGKHLENVPRDTANLSGAYTRHLLGDWDWFAHGNVEYTGIEYTEEWNSSWSVPYTIFNASVGVSRGNLKVGIFCANCGNTAAAIRIGRSFDLRLGPVLSPYDFSPGFARNRPAVYGVHLNYTF